MKREVLLGDEAVGLAALHAGIRGAFAYPGTPSTEIFEFVVQRSAGTGRVSARWSANEKVAYEEALGMSYAGRRALVSMKHVGLNVAADPFMNSAVTGALGGLVLAVADDPGMHSSQNEQDSRYYGEFAQVPVFEPANQQEAYDATLAAFELSEELNLPVMVRLVTRLAHSRATIAVRDEAGQALDGGPTKHGDWKSWTLLPTNARRQYARLVEMQPKLLAAAEQSAFNQLSLRGRRGVIAAGIAYNYVREALGDDESLSVLKIAQYPLPVGLLRQLVDHCDEIVVVEDGYPYIEKRLSGVLGLPGKQIRGRLTGDLPATGELTPDLVAGALGKAVAEHPAALGQLVNRPPALCTGCPHIDTFKALTAATQGYDGATLFSDIGCYTLGALPPFNAVHSCVDMGASISMAHGAAQAGMFPVVCTIGDSTFAHSGMTPLLGAVHANADMTVVILDNATVAMTGSQETMATGAQLVAILKGLGVDERHLHVFNPTPRNHREFVELLGRELNHRGLSVIVAQRPCIHAKRKANERPAAQPVSV